MKKLFGFIFGLLFSILAIPTTLFVASAEEADEPTYKYELSIDGQEKKTVATGDVITIVLRLQRTDKNESYTMYSMQSEIRYDSTFFEFVEGSKILSNGIRSTDIVVDETYREVYMNFLSFTNTTSWAADTVVGSFQLRVIATSGSSKITNEDFAVSLQDGSGSYECTANELTVSFAEEEKPSDSSNEEQPSNSDDFSFKGILIVIAIIAILLFLLLLLSLAGS